MCVSPCLYVGQLSLVLPVNLSSGILCWCWCKDFGSKVREGRSLPALPFLGQGSFLVCLPLGLACDKLYSIFIPPGCRFFSPEPQRHSCFSWAEGEWVFLSLLYQPNTCLLPLVTGMMSPSYTSPLRISCFQSLLIVNALKRRHKMEFPRIEMGGDCCCNWKHKGPPPHPKKGGPISAS